MILNPGEQSGQDPQPQQPAAPSSSNPYAQRMLAELPQQPVQTAPPPRNLFAERMLGELDDTQRAKDQEARFLTAFRLALKVDPDLEGEAQRIGKLLNVAPTLVGQSIEVAREVAKERALRYRNLQESSPVLAEKLADFDFSAIAHDDVDNLATTESAFGAFKKQLDAGASGNERGFIGLRKAMGMSDQVDDERLVEIAARQADAQQGTGVVDAATRVVGQWGGTMVPALGVGAATGALTTPVGGAIAGGATMFSLSTAIEAGNDYLNMRERGIPHEEALTAAGLSGASKAALETLSSFVSLGPVRRAGGVLLAGRALTRETASRAFGTFVREYAKGWATEVATESLQERIAIVAEDIAAGTNPNVRPGEDPQARIDAATSEAGKAMSLLALPGPALHFGAESLRAKRAQADAQFFDRLAKNAADSKVRERNPGAYANHVDKVAEGSGVETVFVDGEKFRDALRQGGFEDDFAQKVPEVAKQVAQAAELGHDIAIPVGQYAAFIAGTELHAAIKPHVRFDPDARSAAEAEGFRQNEREQAGEIQRETEERAASEHVRRQSAQQVEQSLLAQIRATRRLSDTESRHVATVIGSYVEVRAQQAGMQPHEFQARYPLVIAAAEESSGATGLNSPRGDFHPDRGIRLFQKADVSTVLHEAGHWFLDTSAKLAALPDAPAVVTQDVREYLATVGVESVEKWQSMTLDEQRRAHERFAYSFEEYIATGKAPSAELQGLFARVRQWLLNLYGKVRDRLNAQYRAETGEDLPMLSPELRQFFDRMLATDEQIERVQQVDALVPLFDVKPDGVSDAAWQEYRGFADAARDGSGVDLNAASVQQAEWFLAARARVKLALGKEADRVRAAVKAEVAQEVQRQPAYRASTYIRTGLLVDVETGTAQAVGGSTRLRTAAVKAMLPKADLRKLNLTAPDGVDPDTLAPVFGYANGETMVRAILAAPPLEAAVEAATDVRMLEQYSELVSPQSVEEAIAQALHSEARARFVAVEARVLHGASEPVRLMLRAARQAAQNIVGGTIVGNLRPRTHSVAEARAARETRKALRRGDGQAAAKAKRQQMVQIELARESRATLLEVERAGRRFGAFFRPDAEIARTRNVDLIEAARSILSAFGFGEADKPPSAYVERLRAYNPALLDELQPLIDRASAGARDVKALTVDEFRRLRDAVEALWHQARREHEIEVEGKRLELATVANRLADDVRAIGLPETAPGERRSATSRDEWVRDGMSGLATATRVEHWASAMGSNWTRYVWRPVREAITRYRTDRNSYVKRFEELLQRHRDGGHLDGGQIEAREIEFTFANKAELIGAMLHTGNESNLYKLLVGRAWGEERENGSLNTSRWDRFVARMVREGKLTEADMDFVQDVWNLLEGVKPLSQRTHRELFGFYFQEIEARPFGMFGREFRGGYIPAYADRFSVQSARLHEQLAELEGDFRNVVPSVPRGHTKSRDGSARRLSLDVRRLSGHLDEVLRFAHVQPAVRDVMRLLNHRDLQPVLERFNPVAHEKLLLPWLQRAARGITTEPGRNRRMDRFWTALRQNAGLAFMVGNVSNAVQNITGLFVAMVKVKPRYLWPSLFRAITSPNQIAAEIANDSPFMADRSSKNIFEALEGIRDAVQEPTALGKVQAFSRKHGYVLQQLTQNFVDRVTWLAARDQALVELGDMPATEAHREAVSRADAAVRQTQGSLEAEDVSAYEVGTPFWRALTQFQGWFNNLANVNAFSAQRIVREVGWRRGAKRLFGLYVVGMALPMVVAGAIAKTFAGTWDDEDEDGYTDEFADVFFAPQIKGALAAVPVLGQLGTFVWNVASDDSSFNDRMPLPASLSILETGAKAIRGLGDGASGREIRAGSELLTALFGVPASVLGRPAGYVADVAADKVEPTGPVDFARGLVTGRASEGSRR